ncbi:MAG: SRPBCC family protein [Bacteroidetes bacterium]|nr:SRPBCC family protein [Bacteroidota bacterium]
MTTIHNEITIDAPVEKIWNALSNIDMLDQYDPTVKKSTLLTSSNRGIGAKRKVDMLDGKNWFEEKVTAFKPNEALAFELTACSFPVHKLKHSYSFENVGGQIKVKQVMEYDMKFGFLGKLMDALVVRRQSDKGIKKFFGGLKSFVENK